MISAMLRALPIVVLLALVPRHASAQVPLEISGGYSLAHDPRDEVTLPGGWMAGTAVGLTSLLSVVADVSGQHRTIALLGDDARLAVLSLTGGVRASASVGRLTEFGQIVAGAVRTSGSAFGSTAIRHSASVQPGIGVDYPLTRRWAARAQIDVRLMRSQPDAQNGGLQYRFVAGLVYRRARR